MNTMTRVRGSAFKEVIVLRCATVLFLLYKSLIAICLTFFVITEVARHRRGVSLFLIPFSRTNFSIGYR